MSVQFTVLGNGLKSNYRNEAEISVEMLQDRSGTPGCVAVGLQAGQGLCSCHCPVVRH